MSDNNTVQILRSVRKWKKVGSVRIHVGPYFVWRVAVTSVTLNLDWYLANQPHNEGWYVSLVWARSPVHDTCSRAIAEARAVSRNIKAERGIKFLDWDKVFPGD